MYLSTHAIEAMGYSEYPEGDILEINFGIIKVYSIRGSIFDKEIIDKITAVTSLFERCSVVISQSVNDGCFKLTGDKFSDNEEQWQKDNKATSPYLIIYFRESLLRELNGGYRQETDEGILTYDAFPNGKKEIKEWEEERLPGIITSLTVNLSSLDRQVDLVPMGRTVFGITKKGDNLFDLKMKVSGSALVSSPRSINNFNEQLKKSIGLLPILTKEVSRNFYAALNELDRMKQFLGYFQFIERFTHSTFKTLNFTKDAKKIFEVPNRLDVQGSKFFEKFFTDAKTISQRFHWCAVLEWQNLEDDDIKCFLEIKKIRDQLSHGEHVEESDLPLEKAKTLSLKILGATHT
jgi:hypothetical protein